MSRTILCVHPNMIRTFYADTSLFSSELHKLQFAVPLVLHCPETALGAALRHDFDILLTDVWDQDRTGELGGMFPLRFFLYLALLTC